MKSFETPAPSRDRVLQTLFSAIDRVNPLLPRGRKLPKSADTVLLGDASPLDSLGLVNLIVAAEQKLEEEFNVPLALLDEASLSPEASPFLTLGTLADHLHSLLTETLDE